MMVIPFINEIKDQLLIKGQQQQQQQQQHGGLLQLLLSSGNNGTGFLDLPFPSQLLRLIMKGELEPSVWIRMIFPLLFGVGAVLTVFWGFHFRYLLTAQTTLETKVVLMKLRTRALVSLRRGSSRRRASSSAAAGGGETIEQRPINPFDQGWKKNLQQMLGPNLLSLLLPLRSPPPSLPYMPPPKPKDA